MALAWTGGSRPLPYRQMPADEQELARTVFRAHCREYIDFWGRIELDVARLFWMRARYDAHATLRDEK